MRILLARHARSDGNDNEEAYIRDGDNGVGISDLGWQQGIALGQFLGRYYPETGTQEWPVVYISSYKRPKQTLSAALHGMNGALPGRPKLYEDPRLIEKFFGATNHIHNPEGIIDPDFAAHMKLLAKKVYEKDPFATRNLLGESTKDTLMAVKSFLDGTFARDAQEGKDDFLFIVHGAVIQAFLMTWAHLPMHSKNQIQNPGNCDVICIEGQPKNWTITKIYDGEAMKAVNLPVIDHIKPFSVDDLPPVPDQFI
ncbi:MAG: phosphoglycerate mutase family protein [Alphaproteobacteria bacterium]|nr:phosphoglycerate mutase family protein [Alphaproteobacteria bacterium]